MPFNNCFSVLSSTKYKLSNSLLVFLSNKMGMIQNKNHQLYLKSLKQLYDKEVSSRKADYMRRKEEAEKKKQNSNIVQKMRQ